MKKALISTTVHFLSVHQVFSFTFSSRLHRKHKILSKMIYIYNKNKGKIQKKIKTTKQKCVFLWIFMTRVAFKLLPHKIRAPCLNESQHIPVGVNVYFYTFIERKYITLQSSGDQCSPDDESNCKKS